MSGPASPTVVRRRFLLFLERLSRWTAILAAVAVVGVVGYALAGSPGPQAASSARQPEFGLAGQPTARPRQPHVGIVAGHWGYDSGAVCADGLIEQAVNLEIARRVKALLLTGYAAAALVSIHVDSCDYINDIATGFKVARSVASYVPAAEDRLVGCLIDSYAAATGLGFHENSITPDMTSYHTFSEVAPDTPAAIIEIGFLYLDRGFLTGQPDRAASGIAEGIACLVESR